MTDAITPTARQARFREKRKAEGYKFVQVWLPPDAAERLQDIAKGNEIGQAGAIIEAINHYHNDMPY